MLGAAGNERDVERSESGALFRHLDFDGFERQHVGIGSDLDLRRFPLELRDGEIAPRDNSRHKQDQ